ncbi:MAG: NAD(P)H-dependent flavin oxidoreductase [Thiotrichales bacterium]
MHDEPDLTRLRDTRFLAHTQVAIPLICGPMYPCSNPELVAAVSAAGGLGVVQPLSLTFVHGHEFRAGLRKIRASTRNPIGMNALIEQSSRRYLERMERWIEIALEEDVRFFITSLGNPGWVVRRVEAAGGVVYHDVTERKWAEKGLDAGVHGLIAVNARAGGHAGRHEAPYLLEALATFDVPKICAGGIGSAEQFAAAIALGYAGCQLGTRFIATPECNASAAYKQAILDAGEADIALSERITGVPVSIIRTPYVERQGLKAGPIARWMLRGARSKHWMRMWFTLRSALQLKRSLLDTDTRVEFWQAGKSAAVIDRLESAGGIVDTFGARITCPVVRPATRPSSG